MNIRHLNIHVSGYVQGVGFRYTAKKVAQTLQINGFVKNKYDGTVYIEAEGTPENLSDFLSWCHQGPDRAKVSHVSVTEGLVQDFSDFTTRY